MMTLLAQAEAPIQAATTAAPTQTQDRLTTATESVARLFGSFDALAKPETLLKNIQELPIVLAGVFLAAGLVCLLSGFRLYKGVVIVVALITGLVVGFQLGHQVGAELIVSTCLAILLAVIAWPLMKYAVAIAGGMAGAFFGANTWVGLMSALEQPQAAASTPEPWVGALIGLLTFGLLSFIVFELAVVLFTSVSGSVLAVLGSVALLLQLDGVRDNLTRHLTEKPFILPLLVVVPAVVGLVIQQQRGGLRPPQKTEKSGKKVYLSEAA
ncbi:MAG: TMEM198/TM7SF3 family protein [Phycisphaerae bacterium]|nr:TMEM198/TM7SF3 family protein [Phycisphaerae bacterium]